MEASKHEELTAYIAPIIEEYLGTDYEPNSLPLGNWMADYSQLLDDSVKVKAFNVLTYPEKKTRQFLNLFEKSIKKHTNKQTIKKAVKEKLGKFAPDENSKDVKKAYRVIEGMGQSLSDEISSLKGWFNHLNLSDGAPKPEVIKVIGDVLFNLVKFLAFRKFVVKSETSMDMSVFNDIMNDQDGILSTYYPSDHLDRFVDKTKFKNANSRDKKLFDKNIRKFLQEDYSCAEIHDEFLKKKKTKHKIELLDKELEEELITPEVYAEEKENINEQEKGNLGLYGYLEEYLLIACGKLSKLEYAFLNRHSESINLNLELARLGKTIHAFEDFFSHSNFIDFLNLVIYQISINADTPLKGSNQYAKFKSFFDEQLDKRSYTVEENNRSLRSLVKATHDVNSGTGKIDNKISTGYFTGDDVKVSLYHLLIGIVEGISELDSSESVFETRNLNRIVEASLIDPEREKLNFIDKLKSPEAISRKMDKLEEERNKKLSNLNDWYIKKQANVKGDGERLLNLSRKYETRKYITNELYDKKIEQLEEIKSLDTRFKEIQEKYIDGKSNTQDIPEYISASEVKDFFSKDGKFMFASENENQTAEDQQSVMYLGLILNGIIFSQHISIVLEKAGVSFEITKKLFKCIKIVKKVARIIRLLRKYSNAFSKIMRFVILPGFGKYAGEIVDRLMEEMLKHTLEKQLIGLLKLVITPFLDEYRPGSHSLMAKDEEFEKKNLHRSAMTMAKYFDEFIIRTLFSNKRVKIIKLIENAINDDREYILRDNKVYSWKELNPEKKKNVKAIYEYLRSEKTENNEELKEDYADWSAILFKLSYENALPTFLSNKLPNYKIQRLNTDAKLDHDDLMEYLILKQLDKNEQEFDNKQPVININNSQPVINRIKTDKKFKTLPTVPSNANRLITSDFINIILDYKEDYTWPITPMGKRESQEEIEEFIEMTEKMEQKIKDEFIIMNRKIVYYPFYGENVPNVEKIK